MKAPCQHMHTQLITQEQQLPISNALTAGKFWKQKSWKDSRAHRRHSTKTSPIPRKPA